MASIKENTWRIDEKPELTEQLFGCNREEFGTFCFIYGLYIDQDPPQCLIAVCAKEAFAWTLWFHEYLSQFDADSLFSCAYILDTYCQLDHPDEATRDITSQGQVPRFEVKVPFEEDILANSHGILLWHHQLEQLYLLCGAVTWTPTQFRRDINKKKPAVFEYAHQLTFSDGLSLADVIKQRMIFGITSPPNLHGARALMQHV